MTTTTITGEITDPAGAALAGVVVTAALVSAQGGYLTDDTAEILSRVSTTTDAGGEWSLVLTPNAEIEPAGTGYRVTRLVNGRSQVNTIQVPVSGSPVEFASIIVDAAAAGGLTAGGVLAGTYPNPTFADGDLTALAALGDGYPRRSSSTWEARTAAQVATDLGPYQPELNLLTVSPSVDRTGVVDATSALQAGLDAAAAATRFSQFSTVDGTTALPVGATLVIPDGLYSCATGLTWPQGVNVRMTPGARIRATAAMSVLVDTSPTALSQDQAWQGGILDCNQLANTGMYARYFANLRLFNLNVWSAAGDSVILGDPLATVISYEPLVNNLMVRRTKGYAVPSGSRGLWVQFATDGEFSFGIVVGSDIGVRVDRGGNTFSHYHTWGYGGFEPSVNFDDNGTGTTWIGCSADSPTTYGFRLRQSGTRIIAPRFYRNVLSADNIGTALYVDTAGASVSITGWRNAGNDAEHRWALDVDGDGADYVNFVGKQDAFVTTSRGQNQFVQIAGKVLTTSRRASAGSADLEQWQDAAGVVTARVASSGAFTAPTLTPSGLTGATADGRLVGFTTSGQPASGPFVVGDVVFSEVGEVFVCITAGSPGTWLRTHRAASLHNTNSWHAPGTTISTSVTLGNNTLRVVPVQIHRPVTIDTLGFSVATQGEAGSTFRMGVYSGDEYPAALLLDAGTVAADTTGDKTVASLSLALNPGTYWFGGVVQSAPTTQPTIRAITSMPMTVSYGLSHPGSSLVFGYSHASVTGALPSTFASLGTNTIGSAPRVAYRIT